MQTPRETVGAVSRAVPPVVCQILELEKRRLLSGGEGGGTLSANIEPGYEGMGNNLIVDAQSLAEHSATVDWGDTSSDGLYIDMSGSASANHVYDDNSVYGGNVTVETGESADFSALVMNFAPVATLNNSFDDPSNSFTVSLEASDPSSADTQAGLRYSFNTNFDELAQNWASADATSSANFSFATVGSNGAWARVFDKDGGFRDYSSAFKVPDLAVTAASASQLDLTWQDNISGEDGWRVQRSFDGQIFDIYKNLPANSTHFADTDVVDGQKVWYRVRAVGSTNANNTGYSPKKTGVTEMRHPYAVAASPLPDGTVSISWLDESQNEDQFEVKIWTDDIAGSSWVSTGANVKETTISDLEPGRAYRFQVRAINSVTESLFSSELSATPILPAPTNVFISMPQATTAHISWDNHSTFQTKVVIENIGDTVTLGGDSTSTDISDLEPGATYKLLVHAEDTLTGATSEDAYARLVIPATDYAYFYDADVQGPDWSWSNGDPFLEPQPNGSTTLTMSHLHNHTKLSVDLQLLAVADIYHPVYMTAVLAGNTLFDGNVMPYGAAHIVTTIPHMGESASLTLTCSGLLENEGWGIGDAEIDMDPQVSVAPVKPDFIEGGTQSAELEITRTGDLSSDMDVYFSLSGSATRGEFINGEYTEDADFTGGSPVEGSPGVYHATIEHGSRGVPLYFGGVADSLIEGAETIIVTLLDSPTTQYAPPSSNPASAPATAEVKEEDLVAAAAPKPPAEKLAAILEKSKSEVFATREKAEQELEALMDEFPNIDEELLAARQATTDIDARNAIDTAWSNKLKVVVTLSNNTLHVKYRPGFDTNVYRYQLRTPQPGFLAHYANPSKPNPDLGQEILPNEGADILVVPTFKIPGEVETVGLRLLRYRLNAGTNDWDYVDETTRTFKFTVK
jgi:hypothetical protein